jgi:hypothetical protein
MEITRELQHFIMVKYICDGATLKYNYQMGTSSNPVFYLANNAKLKVYGSFFASKVYMKSNATIECFGGNFTAEQLRRELPTTLISVGSGFFDSTFTQINFTFNGWANNANPCNASTESNTLVKNIDIKVYPNPATNVVTISNLPTNADCTCMVFDVFGKIIFNSKSTNNNQLKIDCSSWSAGNYYLKIKKQGIELKNTVISKN